MAMYLKKIMRAVFFVEEYFEMFNVHSMYISKEENVTCCSEVAHRKSYNG